MEHHDVVVIGGGQAGLATSHELTARGLEHVVLERGRVGQAWRDRWDSFCLVTPNWTVQLPGRPYGGSDLDGYLPRDEIAAYLAQYATAMNVPLREEVEVLGVDRAVSGGFRLRTTAGELGTDSLVVCSGSHQEPHRPTDARDLPASVLQLDSGAYRNPSELPPGRILVVGSGQSGCQLAEEIHQAGRDVVLACGRAPWAPRRIGNRDILWWVIETGFLDAPVASLPTPGARLIGNVLGTGHAGGHDLHLRTLEASGVTLVGHFLGVSNSRLHFAPDLGETVAWGDERWRQLMALVRKLVAERDLPDPEILEPGPFDGQAPTNLAVADVGTVIFAGGYRPAYQRLLPWPNAFDALGFPIQLEGASTVIDGLFFAGVHFLRKRKSALLCGIGEDAAIVAAAVAERRGHRTLPA